MRALPAAVTTLALTGLAAPAGASMLAVSASGPPGRESSVPQPPVAVVSRPSACPVIWDVDQANGDTMPCATGDWPAPESAAWTGPLQVAGGDTVRLVLDGPASRVRVSATTGFERGLRTPPQSGPPGGPPGPPGMELRNVQTLDVQDAAPTDDPAVWTVALPDRRELRAQDLAVEATAAEGVLSTFAVRMSEPRYGDDARRCGKVFYGGGQTDTSCPGAVKGPPPIPPPQLSIDRLAKVEGRSALISINGFRIGGPITVTLSPPDGPPLRRTSAQAGIVRIGLPASLRHRLARRSMLVTVTASAPGLSAGPRRVRLLRRGIG